MNGAPIVFTFTYDELLLVALALESLITTYGAALQRLTPPDSDLRSTVARADALLARINEARK